MRLRTTTFLVLLVALFGSYLGTAQDDLRTKAGQIISGASETSDINKAGVPFVLVAKVHFQDGRKATNGIYAISYSVPGRFRRVIRFPGFTQAEVADDGKLYRQRNTPALPLLVWELQQLMNMWDWKLDADSRVKRIPSLQEHAVSLTCPVLERWSNTAKLCVTAAQELASVDIGSTWRGLEHFREHFAFDDYQPFAGKRFPRKLSFRGWGSRSIDVEVEK